MIGKIILGIIALYLLAALYFGVFKKSKFLRRLFKVILFLVIVIIIIAVAITVFYPYSLR